MSTPLAAVGRVVFHYTVNSFDHKFQAYVRNPQLVGGAYKINSRTLDENDTAWEVASVGCNLVVDSLIGTTSVAGITELQLLQGVQWVTVATHQSDAFGAPGVAAVPASQVTLTLRTKLNHKVRVTLMEMRETPAQLIKSTTGGDASMDNLIQHFLATYTQPQDPYVWQVGRDNQFLATNPFVSCSVYLNRKLARRRGI